jgi:hypothetical protein
VRAAPGTDQGNLERAAMPHIEEVKSPDFADAAVLD